MINIKYPIFLQDRDKWIYILVSNGDLRDLENIDVEDNEYIRPNFAHPNHNGHALIAKKLAEWIKL